jgi:hypothetical protein
MRTTVRRGSKVDHQIEAQEFGDRFHVFRGSMSLSESMGGLPPDEACDAPQESSSV